MRPGTYEDDAAVRAKTLAVMQHGTTVLQVFHLGRNEREHVQRLLELFAPRRGALVLDAGSGVGGVASIMQELRPDLDFILLNISAAQLELSPARFARIQGDIEGMPIPSASVDAVMLNYSLGHADLGRALFEASRVLRAGGVLFIYDLDGTPQDLPGMSFRVYGRADVQAMAERLGFREDPLPPLPAGYTDHMLNHVDGDTLQTVFGGVAPLALRFHL